MLQVILLSAQEVNLKVFSIFHNFQLKYAQAHGARIFSSHYTLFNFTESNNDSHYSYAGKSLQHGVSGHNKQCGWLSLYDLVQSWSSFLAVPLSFKDNCSILCVFSYFQFWYENINISNSSRRVGWTGLGTAKLGCFPLYFFLSHFSPTGSCSTGLPSYQRQAVRN